MTQSAPESEYSKNFQDALPFGLDSLYINLTVPLKFNKKIPITVFVSDAPANVKLGAYLYTIGRGKETFNTILNQADQDLIELATKISRALCLKYESPVYFSISGSYDPLEFLPLIKLILDHIYAKIESLKTTHQVLEDATTSNNS